MAAAVATAVAPAAVVLLGKNEVALGRVVEIAGLQRLGGGGHRPIKDTAIAKKPRPP